MNLRRTATALLGTLLGLLTATCAHATADEDELKLAFTYNLARFVTWPDRDDKDADDFRLCVMGDDAYRMATDNLSNRRVGEQPISVVAIERPADATGQCDLLYLPNVVDDADAFVTSVDAEPVLTVSDAPGFAELGGIVELSRRSDRVAMRINVEASRRAGLTISSQLLSLATLVANEAEGD